MFKSITLIAVGLLFSINLYAQTALKGGENPGYIEKPIWFKNSFLDIREDLEEAVENKKRILLYFYQDGCPYCAKLIKDNFYNKTIANKTQQYFDVIAINMWGDKEVLSFTGKETTEKAFAKSLRVQFTPTLLMLDEKGEVVLRINGYYHPDKFTIALEYVGKHLEQKKTFITYLKDKTAKKKTYAVITAQNNIKNEKNLNLSAKNGKPFLVIFENEQCQQCTELHEDILNRPLSQKLLKQFNVITFDMWSKAQLFTPSGKLTTWANWTKKLDIKYAPGLVFFDNTGKEIIRTEGYLKSFHIQSVMDYVLSGAYKTEPELQRFIEYRAGKMREKGLIVDLMN